MIEQSRIEAFVGKNSVYYLEKWRLFENESNSRVNFNKAAFFLSAIWLVYRKLYFQLGVLFIVLVADISISVFLEDAEIVSPIVIALWDRFSPIVYGTVIGMWGNYWYFRRFRSFDDDARTQSPDPAIQETFLGSKGGTNVLGVSVLIILFVALIAATLVYL